MNNTPTGGLPVSEAQVDRAFEQQLREMNDALIVSSVHQHEVAGMAEKAEAAARESGERYRALFDLVPAAVYCCDAAGVIQQFNRVAVELWGRVPAVGDTDERFCGSFKMFRPDGSFMPHEQCPMADVVSGKIAEVRNGELFIERPDGSRVIVVVNIRPLKNQYGQVTGAINCFYDITERKKFEDEREAYLINEQASRMEAEAANRSKDLFLATLSHEVRTPLNAILGWASILRSGKCSEAEVHEGMEVIERNCKAQAQLIEDVLDVSRIVSGKLRLHLRQCELVEIIHAAIDAVRPAANARGVRIETVLDPAASSALCDQNRMQQVIWNLLSNAVKFTPGGKTVRVALARDGPGARIQVRDEGKGISPEFLPYVFDRFRQADSGTRRQLGGLGLGLSIVKHIVEVHGGTVHADSAGEGRGAVFTVNLPVGAVRVGEADADAAAGSDKDASSKPTAVRLDGLRVLVVDDEADSRRLLARVLGDAGAIVTGVGSAGEALATVKPHVLVSDIAMPLQDGYDLIRQIRSAGLSAKELPAAALTAFAHNEDRRRVLLAGFQIHVPKPVDPHDLTAVVASLAGRTG